MSSSKIRNFYVQRFIEKIKNINFLVSKIFYNSPVYGKLNFEEIGSYADVVIPNLWEGDVEKMKDVL